MLWLPRISEKCSWNWTSIFYVVFYWFKRFREDMRTLENGATTGHTATAWNLETIAKACELVTTDRCLSLKLMQNQVQVDFQSGVLNYSLGPITWNSIGIKGTWILWDTFLHALYIQSDTDSFIHLVVCLTTGPRPLPNQALHIVRSRASSF
jgi:hypothetical protein